MNAKLKNPYGNGLLRMVMPRCLMLILHSRKQVGLEDETIRKMEIIRRLMD